MKRSLSILLCATLISLAPFASGRASENIGSVVAVQEYVPEIFLSYWAPGAPEGILTIEFSAPLLDDGQTVAELGWGNLEYDGEYYHEKLACKIEGNKLSVDFTGKLRTPALMTPMFPNSSYSNMMIKVLNVRDEDGKFVASPGAGTTGSYHYYPPYQEISRSKPVAEFTPASGSPIKDVANVNVWITGLDAISFSGFNLAVTSADNKESTVYLPLSDVKVTPTDSNESEYDFVLPDDIKNNAKRLMITLANVASRDGYNHQHDIKCIYGGFTISDVAPANGEDIPMLKAGSSISCVSRYSDEFLNLYVECTLRNMNSDDSEPVLLSPTPMTLQSDGRFLLSLPENIKLYAGNEYIAEFTAWKDEATRLNDAADSFGTDYVVWNGTSSAYHYCAIGLVEITPSTDADIAKDTDKITLRFDGIVGLGNYNADNGELKTGIVTADGSLIPFSKVAPSDPMHLDNIDYAIEWNLYLPSGYAESLSSPLEIRFNAFDVDKIPVKGNKGMEKDTYFNLIWSAEAGSNSVEIADAESVFSVFTISGSQILKDATKDDLTSLSPGLYIINGKKVILK